MNERLIKLMEHLQYTPSVFADEIGVIRSSISHIMSGRNKPGVELLQRVLKRFPEVSAEWLLAGIGPMFKESHRTIVNSQPVTEPARELTQNPGQTSLLGYIESIKQPTEGPAAQKTDRVMQPEPADNESASPEPSTGKETVEADNTFKQESVPAFDSAAAANEMPQKAVKEKAISRIIVYYNDRTYQEFRMSED